MTYRILHRDETSKHLPFVLESPPPRTALPGAITVSRALPRAGVYDVKYLCDPECHRLSVDSPVDISSLEGFQVSAKAATLLHRALQHEHGARRGTLGALPHVGSFAALDQEIRQMTLALLQDSVDWRYALVSSPPPAFFSLGEPRFPCGGVFVNTDAKFTGLLCHVCIVSNRRPHAASSARVVFERDHISTNRVS